MPVPRKREPGKWWAITEPDTKERLMFATESLITHRAEWKWLRVGDLFQVVIPMEEQLRIEDKNNIRNSAREIYKKLKDKKCKKCNRPLSAHSSYTLCQNCREFLGGVDPNMIFVNRGGDSGESFRRNDG